MDRIAYLDCYAGIAGDMTVAALLDAGLSLDRLRSALGDLGVPGWSLEAARVRRAGVAATHVQVICDRPPPSFHRYTDLLDAARAAQPDLPAAVKEQALQVIHRLGSAEAAVHDCAPEDLHLHGLGALDTLVDAYAVAAALHLSGVQRVAASPAALGSGHVQVQGHGLLPGPAPATMELLRGLPVQPLTVGGRLVERETVTPTGAAILAVLATERGPMPAMQLEAVGYGAGTADPEDGPANCLRVLLGRSTEAGAAGEVWVLECNLDDESPQVLGALVPRLLAAGAADAWLSPLLMKKGRPGMTVRALAEDAFRPAVEDLMLRETGTLGLRCWRARRTVLARRSVEVATPWGPVRTKVRRLPDGHEDGAPEFEDCHRLAEEHGVPLRQILAAARTSLEHVLGRS